jgi:DtxR family Mn-dependent transcriptional regulator
MQTQAVEDYLKAVFELERELGKVATSRLAERLQVTAASATGMIKKLARMRLLTHAPYRGVVLTTAGRRIALEILRHHRLIEAYLAEALGVPWDRVHAEAERWEHVVSVEMAERMAAVLGHPVTDPHGAPIPDRDGRMAAHARDRLSDLRPGRRVVIAEVADRDPALLQYLGGLGLTPAQRVEVREVAPFDGPLTVMVNGAAQVVGRQAAAAVYVTAAPGTRPALRGEATRPVAGRQRRGRAPTVRALDPPGKHPDVPAAERAPRAQAGEEAV